MAFGDGESSAVYAVEKALAPYAFSRRTTNKGMVVNKLNLNLGCGDTAPDGWVNCDSSWNAQLSKLTFAHQAIKKMGLVSEARWPVNVRYLSLAKRFPWNDGSVDVVYASHVFEHLDQRVADNFMRESMRILKRGGVLRIVVPDLLFHAKRYVQSTTDGTSGAEEFLAITNLRLPVARSLIHNTYNLILGHPSLHKQMYDWVTLRKAVESYGFMDIKQMSHGASESIENILDVEGPGAGYEGSLYLEALK